MDKRRRKKTRSGRDWEKSVVDSARENHIWLNAFSCVKPSKEFCAGVGRVVLEWLSDPARTIPSEHRLVGSERCLVVRFNKS